MRRELRRELRRDDADAIRHNSSRPGRVGIFRFRTEERGDAEFSLEKHETVRISVGHHSLY